MHRSTLKYTLTAVLATGAIATSPALAMPIDGPINRGDSPSGSLAGTTEKNLKKQDLRGELAKDRYFQAATPDKVQPGQPVFPAYVPALPKPKPVPASAPVTDDGDDVGIWLLLLSGLAGAGLAGGGAAGIARRSRVRARRVTA
jgi:hypothetical protein